MKKEDFISKIGFKERELTLGIVNIKGSLILEATVSVPKRDYDNCAPRAKEQIQEMIWRELHEDNRKQFAEKMVEFVRMAWPINPNDSIRFRDLQNELFKLAGATSPQ